MSQIFVAFSEYLNFKSQWGEILYEGVWNKNPPSKIMSAHCVVQCINNKVQLWPTGFKHRRQKKFHI